MANSSPRYNIILRANNISKEFIKGKHLLKILNQVNLEIKYGEFIIIMGPSGSGKTTLLNILSGLEQPTEGTVIIEDEKLNSLTEEQLTKIRNEVIGFIFQDYNLLDHLTVLENVESPAWVTNKSAKDIKEKAFSLLRAVDLIERKDHFPRQLSGGEKQRAAIARALINNPKIVFADEPTGNLDGKTTDTIMKVLKRLQERQNVTIIMVTHDESLSKYATRKFRLADGKLVKA